MSNLFLLCVFLIAGCSRYNGNEMVTINLKSCLVDLATVDTFAKRPLGKAAMISTYDRSGGNRDWGNLRKSDKDGLVTIANLEGPGCVKRIWMTSVPATEWCFFFDGEKVPRIKMKDKDLFGKVVPFLPPLCDKVSGGAYCYMPIPYNKSLRIAVAIPELKKTARPYYHINYETYPVGTDVESFPVALSEAQEQTIETVKSIWRNNEKGLNDIITACDIADSIYLPAGRETELIKYNDTACLSAFYFKINDEKLSSYRKDRLLRELRLRIYWDGNKAASVDVPFGDFFCNGINNRKFSSMALGHIGDAFICRFPMPFKQGVRMTLSNSGKSDVNFDFKYKIESLSDNEINYFHARWTQSLSAGRPLNVLRTRGQGHYVGCYLVGRGIDGSWNILEGDESFRIDGEATPSLHGTGLEDYFNGAWYYYGLFDLPTHGLLEKAAMNTCQYRFHIGDPIKFDSSLSMNFEFGDANRTRGYMSATAYWYQKRPVASGTVMPSIGGRYPKLGQVELGSVMASLFELERAGLYEDAKNRCLYYAERLNNPQWSEMLALRAVRYEEELYGFAAVSNKYEQISANTKVPEVAKQAKQLLWFNKAPTNVLLGLHINGGYKAYIDGKPIESGSSMFSLSVSSLSLLPGEHEIAVDAAPTNPDAWVSVCLRMHGTNDVSSTAWVYSKQKPALWPDTDDKSIIWQPVDRADAMLPVMGAWQFSPNAFINMQSGKQLMRPWPSWRNDPAKKTAYLRRRVIVK